MLKDPENTIGGMADRAKFAMLSYLDGQGFPTSRAMLPPRIREGIHTFWFTTNTSSPKTACLRKNPRASIYFVDLRFFRGASLSGTVEILEDPQSKAKLWREGDTMYYPRGIADPDYCVLRFTARYGVSVK